MRAREVFEQSNGDVTKAYYSQLASKGPLGELAVALLRAHKRSKAAKTYRKAAWRREAYEAKNYSLREVARWATLINSQEYDRITWGWGRDDKAVGYEWVLYLEMPFGRGQCSFHSAERLDGPDYPGEWDGQKDVLVDRICSFCDDVMFGLVGPEKR